MQVWWELLTHHSVRLAWTAGLYACCTALWFLLLMTNDTTDKVKWWPCLRRKESLSFPKSKELATQILSPANLNLERKKGLWLLCLTSDLEGRDLGDWHDKTSYLLRPLSDIPGSLSSSSLRMRNLLAGLPTVREREIYASMPLGFLWLD